MNGNAVLFCGQIAFNRQIVWTTHSLGGERFPSLSGLSIIRDHYRLVKIASEEEMEQCGLRNRESLLSTSISSAHEDKWTSLLAENDSILVYFMSSFWNFLHRHFSSWHTFWSITVPLQHSLCSNSNSHDVYVFAQGLLPSLFSVVSNAYTIAILRVVNCL